MATIDSLRMANDYATTATCVIGEAAYEVNLITIINDQINFNDSITTPGRTVSIKRLTIADGYRGFVTPDGYMNVPVKQVDGEQLLLSGGIITNQLLILGPISFPYTAGHVSGGIDPNVFQPPRGSSGNTQIFIQLQGQSLSSNGNFFEIKQIMLSHMATVCYNLLLQATASNPLL
jgi:hypothetical protein